MCNITFITFRSLIFWIIKGIQLLEWKNWWDKSVNRKFFIHSSSGKMTFHWKGPIDDRTFHRTGGGTMVIPRPGFGLGGLQNIGQFHQLVGRTGLIFKQTLTGSVPKWMTRNRYPVDTCTAQLASRVICIYVFAPCVRFHSRDFRLESCLCASFSRPFHPRGNRINYARYKSHG